MGGRDTGWNTDKHIQRDPAGLLQKKLDALPSAYIGNLMRINKNSSGSMSDRSPAEFKRGKQTALNMEMKINKTWNQSFSTG